MFKNNNKSYEVGVGLLSVKISRYLHYGRVLELRSFELLHHKIANRVKYFFALKRTRNSYWLKLLISYFEHQLLLYLNSLYKNIMTK